ncbi:MAG: response regulator transcription factor [Chloroflexi bacterium]|nr:response regulator transcription factor [Ktedonobacteraceae bacterium]MBV9707357.1 response regulator transcription factor [Chloroflexota bacterium]
MTKPGAAILVVDDEPEIVRALQRSLTAHGYKVFTATSGEEAIEAVSRTHADLILLDLLLPDMSGLEVTRQIRAVSNIPIIVLSVKDAERDKVEALDLGADDYVAKPFGIDEVLARVRVALRHLAQAPSGSTPYFQAGPLSIDFALRRVLLSGKEIALTPTEYDLLKVFITHRGKLLTRQMLLREVWGNDAYGRVHSLHVYVAQLRQKIEPIPEQPSFILTIPGVGYRFNDSLESQE